MVGAGLLYIVVLVVVTVITVVVGMLVEGGVTSLANRRDHVSPTFFVLS